MKYRALLTLVIPLLFLMSACGQVSNSSTNAEKLMGKWKAVDSTSFRGKQIEFHPDHQVTLILVNGGQQDGQYELKDNTITFSIGDAPPFTMNYRLEDDQLYLVSSDSLSETKYTKLNE
jgi:hypothetical protein